MAARMLLASTTKRSHVKSFSNQCTASKQITIWYVIRSGGKECFNALIVPFLHSNYDDLWNHLFLAFLDFLRNCLIHYSVQFCSKLYYEIWRVKVLYFCKGLHHVPFHIAVMEGSIGGGNPVRLVMKESSASSHQTSTSSALLENACLACFSSIWGPGFWHDGHGRLHPRQHFRWYEGV